MLDLIYWYLSLPVLPGVRPAREVVLVGVSALYTKNIVLLGDELL